MTGTDPLHGDSDTPLIKPLSKRQIRRLMKLVTNFDEAIKSLPEDEQRKYREAQQSVIDARRAGERIAHELWID